MIINYDRNPNISTDQKLQSLMESIQLALNEITSNTDNEIANVKESIANIWGDRAELTKDGVIRVYPSNNSGDAGFIVEQNNTNKTSAFLAKRNDTGVEVWMGVGAGGTNHGVYSQTLSKWIAYCNGNSNSANYGHVYIGGIDTENILHTGYAPKSDTPSITASTGTLVSASAAQYGKVVQLNLIVKNSAAVASGGNLFVGTLSTTALRPIIAARGTGFNTDNAFVGTLNSSGSITVRNCGSDALAANVEILISFTYLVS